MVLSYRHAFVAGGYSDVFKHVLLISFLRRCTAVSGSLNPFEIHSTEITKTSKVQNHVDILYIDTHAGPGRYSLLDRFALNRKEYRKGIEKVLVSWRDATAKVNIKKRSNDQRVNETPMLLGNEDLNRYVNIVQSFNQDKLKQLMHYPGSPLIASEFLNMKKVTGRRIFYELHKGENDLLHKTFAKRKLREHIGIFHGDGVGKVGIRKTITSPQPAMMLIDPSYEGVYDYTKIPSILQRFNKKGDLFTMLWYPQIIGKEHLAEQMLNQIKLECRRRPWVHLNVKKRSAPGEKFAGLGLFFLNAPPGIDKDACSVSRTLATVLGGEVFLETSDNPEGEQIASEPENFEVEKLMAAETKKSVYENDQLEDHILRKGKPIKFL